MGSISGQGTKTPHDWGLRFISWGMPPPPKDKRTVLSAVDNGKAGGQQKQRGWREEHGSVN